MTSEVLSNSLFNAGTLSGHPFNVGNLSNYHLKAGDLSKSHVHKLLNSHAFLASCHYRILKPCRDDLSLSLPFKQSGLSKCDDLSLVSSDELSGFSKGDDLSPLFKCDDLSLSFIFDDLSLSSKCDDLSQCITGQLSVILSTSDIKLDNVSDLSALCTSWLIMRDIVSSLGLSITVLNMSGILSDIVLLEHAVIYSDKLSESSACVKSGVLLGNVELSSINPKKGRTSLCDLNTSNNAWQSSAGGVIGISSRGAKSRPAIINPSGDTPKVPSSLECYVALGTLVVSCL